MARSIDRSSYPRPDPSGANEPAMTEHAPWRPLLLLPLAFRRSWLPARRAKACVVRDMGIERRDRRVKLASTTRRRLIVRTSICNTLCIAIADDIQRMNSKNDNNNAQHNRQHREEEGGVRRTNSARVAQGTTSTDPVVRVNRIETCKEAGSPRVRMMLSLWLCAFVRAILRAQAVTS